MLNIAQSIKNLFKTDGVCKNFRVHFPNGEFSDITNDNVVQESVHYTESICSQDVFRFGLAEASVLEFETVGVGNMYGMTIEAGIEIDCSSLSAAEIVAIQADAGDGTFLPAQETATVSGAIASFEAGERPLVDLSVSIEPVQSLNGYDKPWPAGGGVNKLIECVPGTYTSANCQAVVSADGTITVSGTSGSSSEQIIIPLKAKITVPNEQFYFHLFNTVNASMAPSLELSTNVAGTTINAACSPANRILTVSSDRFGVEIDRVRFWIAANTNAAATLHPLLAMTNAVVPWTPYENICPITGHTGANIYVSPTTDAQDGDTYSITFPSEAGTVYGGTLDVTSGVLTVDKFGITIDGTTVAANGYANYGTLRRFQVPWPSGKTPNYTGATTFCLSDKLTPSFDNTIGANQTRPEGFYCFPHSAALFVSMPSADFSSTETANAWFAEHTPTVVYPLANPVTYQLTSTEVMTMLGTNNVWADTGDVSVTYPISPEHFRVPLGVFRVESCPRNHGAMAHRQVTAYGDNFGSNKGLSPIEKWKLGKLWNDSEYGYASLSSLIDANIAWNSPKYIDDNFTKEQITLGSTAVSGTGGTVRWTYYQTSNVYYMHETTVQTALKRYFTADISAVQGADALFSIERVGAIDGVTNNVSILTLYQALKAQMSDVPGVGDSPIEGLIKNAFYGLDNNSKIVFHSAPGGIAAGYSFKDPQPIVLLSGNGATAYIFKGYTLRVSDTVTKYSGGSAGTPTTTIYTVTQDVYIDSSDGPEVSTLTKTNPLNVPITIPSTGDVTKNGTTYYSYAGAYSLRDVFGADMELSAQFGLVDRTNNVKVFALDNSSPIAIVPGDYEAMWWDEYDVDEIGSVIAAFIDSTSAEEVTATVEIGDGASVYDMTDNDLIKSLLPTSLADLTTLLSGDFATNSQAAAFTPVELTMQGWPWIEAGDALEITAEDGTIVDTYALRVEMSGIQYLTATITAEGGEIIDTEADEE